ncbi:MAG: hypothetical protein Ct9H300mP11_09450 [Chloroflexota bacterium]|nr:MAG: hypothetical protein Ct9H300mP11_09450 [Chloroflexota bacterium]
MSLGVLTMLEKLLLLQLWYRAELNGWVKVSSKKLSTNSPKGYRPGPQYADAWERRSEAYTQLGRSQQAEDDRRHLQGLGPSSSQRLATSS